jgi:hypothetical protein
MDKTLFVNKYQPIFFKDFEISDDMIHILETLIKTRFLIPTSGHNENIVSLRNIGENKRLLIHLLDMDIGKEIIKYGYNEYVSFCFNLAADLKRDFDSIILAALKDHEKSQENIQYFDFYKKEPAKPPQIESWDIFIDDEVKDAKYYIVNTYGMRQYFGDTPFNVEILYRGDREETRNFFISIHSFLQDTLEIYIYDKINKFKIKKGNLNKTEEIVNSVDKKMENTQVPQEQQNQGQEQEQQIQEKEEAQEKQKVEATSLNWYKKCIINI